MAYNPNNPNGQATSANSSPVVLASDQTAIPITDNGGSVTIDGTVTANAGTGTMNVSVQNASIPVTGTFFQATQPISGTVTVNPLTNTSIVKAQLQDNAGTAIVLGQQLAANSLPVVLTAAQITTLTPLSSITVNNGSAGSAVNIQDGGNSITVDGTVTANISGSISNTSFIATQATGTNLHVVVDSAPTTAVTGTFFQATQPVSLATNTPTLQSGSTTDVTQAIGTNLHTVVDSGVITTVGAVTAITNALPTGTNSIGEVTANAGTNLNTSALNLETTQTAISAKLPATLGQKAMAASMAVVLASDQTSIPVAATLTAETTKVIGTVNLSASQTLATVTTVSTITTGAAPHIFGYVLYHKDGEYATQQTSTSFYTPTVGKKFTVTDLTISVGGTTSGIVTVYDAASATAYSAGVTPAIFRGVFAPSTTANPGMVKSFNVPYVSTTINNRILVTTSAAMTVYIQVNGYEV